MTAKAGPHRCRHHVHRLLDVSDSNGRDNFKSVTASKTTFSGNSQRVAPLTNVMPIRHDTKLKSVA